MGKSKQMKHQAVLRLGQLAALLDKPAWARKCRLHESFELEDCGRAYASFVDRAENRHEVVHIVA